MTRRRLGLAVAIAATVAAGTVAVAGATRDPDGREAKNVILLVGDGLGPTHIEAARIRYHGPAGRLALEQLPRRGVVSTYSVEPNSTRPDLVTDSASAATAWASGVKTYDNAVGKDAFGRVVPSLMDEAKESGMRTGNVSTAEITDATPAAMVAHVSRRGCQGPDFAAGACQEPGQGQARRRGFLLQVEGGLIDKRSHANDAAQTLEEVRAFDEAVRIAVDFARRDRRTLVVVTADHETAGFSIIPPDTFTNAEATNPPGDTDPGNPANASAPDRSPAANTKDAARSRGIANGGAGGGTPNFGPATFRTPDDPPDVVDGTPEASLWTAYGSGNHTGAGVPIYAFGPASDQFAGPMDNTHIYRKIKKALRAL